MHGILKSLKDEVITWAKMEIQKNKKFESERSLTGRLNGFKILGSEAKFLKFLIGMVSKEL